MACEPNSPVPSENNDGYADDLENTMNSRTVRIASGGPRRTALLCVLGVIAVGCGESGGIPIPDGGTDAGADAGADSGVDAGTDAGPDAGTDAGMTESVIFVTDTVHTGALDGPTGADAICASQATAAGLEGEFVAWLSTIASSVSDRLVQSAGPYVRVDGTLIANDWDDLVDGSIMAPINLDAGGNPQGGDTWTGTLADGTPYLGNDCAGFTTDSSGVAQCGSSASTGAAWTENITPSCATSLRLYCVQQ